MDSRESIEKIEAARARLPFLSRVIVDLQVAWDRVRMWRRRRSGRYEMSRQWFNIGRDITPEQAYAEVLQFTRHAVNLSPRPYGYGAFELVLAAIWGEEDGSPTERWQPAPGGFLYQDRQEVFDRLQAHIEAWDPPPLAIMVGILPYGALATGRPAPAPN